MNPTHSPAGSLAPRPASLARGTDGAIMVAGAFMAVFLVGLLYYAVGVGQAVLVRERMQDAADSAAYSAAVVSARGMNLIALANLLNSAALAVWVALLTVQNVTIAALARIPLRAPLADRPDLLAVQATVQAQFMRPEVSGTIISAMRASSRAANALREGTPEVARLAALDRVRTFYQPRRAFVHSGVTLPTQPDTDNAICRETGDLANLVGTTPYFQYPGLSPNTQNYVNIQVDTIARTTGLGQCTSPPTLRARPADMRPQTTVGRLGDDGYQVRAFILGGNDLRGFDRGVRIANRARDDAWGTGELGTGFQYERNVAIAQAEFYYDDSSPTPTDTLWDTMWRARLRRVWFSATTTASELELSCQATPAGTPVPGTASCAPVGQFNVRFLSEAVVH